MKAKLIVAVWLTGFVPTLSYSQVLDSPITVQVGVTARFNANNGTGTYLFGSFGGGVPGTLYQAAPPVAGWYESGETWFNVRPGQGLFFTVLSRNVGDFKLHFDPPPNHRVFIVEWPLIDDDPIVTERMASGNGSFGPNFSKTYFVVVSPLGVESQGYLGEATSLRPQRILWSVSMGNLRNSRGAGFIQLREATVTDAVNSGKLYYDETEMSKEVHVVLDTGGALRQILTPDGLADIVQVGADYDIRFYRINQVGSFNGTTYPVSGSAFITYTVHKVTDDHMQITRVRGGRNERVELQKMTGTRWEIRDWTSLGQTCQRTIVYDYPSGSAIEEVTVKNGSTVARKTRKTYTSVGGYLELASENAGADTANQITSYTYYDSAGSPGSYRKLKSVTRPEGGWVKYEYFDGPFERQGQLSLRHEPYKDSPSSVPTAPTTNGKVTDYSYVADWTGAQRRLSGTATTINGIQTGQTVIIYSDSSVGGRPVVVETRTEYASASQTKVTKLKYFREDAPADTFQYWPGRLHSIEYPDGTKQTVSYMEGDFVLSIRQFTPVPGSYYVQEVVMTGSATSAGAGTWSWGSYPVDTVYIVPNQSTLEEVVRSRAGFVMYRAKWVHNGTAWVRVDGVLSANQDRMPLDEYHDNGRYSAQWGYTDGRMTSFTDADGVQFTYAYDQQGRLATSTKTGIVGSSPFQEHKAITTTYGYDADNRLLSALTGAAGTAETLSLAREFDQAGRLTKDTHHDSGEININYPSAGQVRMVLPGPISGVSGEGMREVITETYLDGRFKQRVGNADIPEFDDYVINGNGTERLSQKPTNSSSHDRSLYTTFDWLGRPSQTYYPTFEHETDGGAWNITDFHRSGPDRLNITVNYTQAQSWGGGNVRITPDHYFNYGKVGELVQSGLDINGAGGLEAGSKDRIVNSEERFEVFGGQTWRVNRTKVLPTASVSIARTVEEVRELLSGLSNTQISVVESYDAGGRKTTETVSVDRANRVRTSTVVTDGVGNAATTQWHNGLLFRTTSPASVITTSEYDALGRLKKVKGRSSVEERYTYVYGKTLILTIGNAYLTSDQFTYDSAGRVSHHQTTNISSTSGGPRTGTERFEYNALGQVARQWGNAVQPVAYGYNEFGQMTLMTTFDSNNAFATQSTWPGGGGRNTTWAYQPRTGLLRTKTDAANHTTSYEYNVRGQVRKRTVQRGQTADNPPQPINVVTEYFYYDGKESDDNQSGHISYRTGELKRIEYPNSGLGATASNISYAYDRMGRISAVGDAAGIRSFAYRDSSDLQLDYETLPALYGSRKITRSYETGTAPGRYSGFAFKESDDSALHNAGYTYTGLTGRLDKITRLGLPDTAYTYEPGSDLVLQMTTGTWYRKNTWQSWRELVDSVENRFTGSSSAVALYISDYDWLMHRDAMTLKGDIAARHGNSIGVRNRYWAFLSGDVWDREELRQTRTYGVNADNSDAAEITSPDRYRKWDYSVAGNRTKEVRAGDWQQVYNVSNNVDQIGSITGTGHSGSDYAWGGTPAYDFAGNMTTLPDGNGGTWTIDYDAENRPVKLQKGTNSTRLEMKYDYLGRRIEKAVFPNNITETPTSRTRFVYDGWNVIAELNAESSNAVLRTYTWGLDASHSMDGAGGVGGLIRMEQIEGAATVAYYPIYDSAHNVAGLVKSDGTKTVSYAYGPFGEVTSTWKSDANFTDTNPFRFSTKYTDSETGLVYFGFRYYHPKLGRFINRDPIGEEGGINLHQYVGNNPVSRWDFLGLDWTTYQPVHVRIFRNEQLIEEYYYVASATLSDWDGKSGGMLISSSGGPRLSISQPGAGRVTFTGDNSVTHYQPMIETLENSDRWGSGPRDHTPRLKEFGGEGGAPRFRTWNDFQRGTAGQFRSRGDAADAWAAYKNANSIDRLGSFRSLAPRSDTLRSQVETRPIDRYSRLREAVDFLKNEAGVASADRRRQIVESFGPDMRVGTFRGQAYQYSGFGPATSRYLTPSPLARPIKQLALPPSNPAFLLRQYNVTSTRALLGTVAPQNFGVPLSGGAQQIFVPTRYVLRPTLLIP